MERVFANGRQLPESMIWEWAADILLVREDR